MVSIAHMLSSDEQREYGYECKVVEQSKPVRLYVSVELEELTCDGVPESATDGFGDACHGVLCQTRPFMLGVGDRDFMVVEFAKRWEDVYCDIDDGCDLFKFNEVTDAAAQAYEEYDVGFFLRNSVADIVPGDTLRMETTSAMFGLYVKEVPWEDVTSMQRVVIRDGEVHWMGKMDQLELL